MANLNRATIIGRLGKDPEIKKKDDLTIAIFSVATSENRIDKDGKTQEKTEWHNIAAFGKLAEACKKYLTKGKHVYIEGKLQTDSWKKGENTFYQTKIIAENVQFLDPKK